MREPALEVRASVGLGEVGEGVPGPRARRELGLEVRGRADPLEGGEEGVDPGHAGLGGLAVDRGERQRGVVGVEEGGGVDEAREEVALEEELREDEGHLVWFAVREGRGDDGEGPFGALGRQELRRSEDRDRRAVGFEARRRLLEGLGEGRECAAELREPGAVDGRAAVEARDGAAVRESDGRVDEKLGEVAAAPRGEGALWLALFL